MANPSPIERLPAALPCPLCGSGQSETLFERDAVPVLLNRFYLNRAASLAAPLGRLQIAVCSGCGFTFNRCFDPSLVVYDAGYDNDQTGSPRFAVHLDGIRDRLLGLLAQRPARVLEIGCGQAGFLEALVARSAASIEAVGWDPAWRPRPVSPDLRVAARAFGAERPEEPAFDLVYARHVIEHVADPVALLAATASVLTPGGCVCVEVPALEWILAQDQQQDFFYEHCNYFSAASLADAFRRAGFGAVRIDRVFGGQYLWAEASLEGAPPDIACAPVRRRPEMGGLQAWRRRLVAFREAGRVALWGAGAKGVSFAREVDPAAELLAGLIDINVNKQRHFIPGSGHPVLSPEAAARIGIAVILVMNPIYADEIAAQAASAGLCARFVPVAAAELSPDR